MVCYTHYTARVYTSIHPDKPRQEVPRAWGDGLTGKDRLYLWAMIPSETQETQVSGVPPPPPNTGPGASCISWLSRAFPASLGQGRSKVQRQLHSKPEADQNGADRYTRLIHLGSSSHEAPLGADLGVQLLCLVSAEAQVQEAGCCGAGAGQAGDGRAGVGAVVGGQFRSRVEGPTLWRPGQWLTLDCSLQVAPVLSIRGSPGSPPVGGAAAPRCSPGTGSERISVPEKPIQP